MSVKNIQATTAVNHLDTIITDIEQLIKHKQDFIAFVILSLAIEFLGSFSDPYAFDDFGQSDNRFKNGIKLFKNNWYKANANLLFKNFRGPLVHQYRTSEHFYLTSTCKDNVSVSYHLQKEDNRRILVLEQFLEDFKMAAESFKKQVEKSNNSLNKEKLHQQYAFVSNTSLSNETNNQDITVSGSTSNNVTAVVQTNRTRNNNKDHE